MREGVCIRNLTYRTDFEAMTGIRLKMNNKDLFDSILIAFDNYGKNYDYSFDFDSHEGLICSELIWKSFKKAKQKQGLHLTLSRFLDVKNISPTPLLRQALYEKKQNFPVRFIFFLQYNFKKKVFFYQSKKKLLKILAE
jgi:hypothetical protein